MIAGIRRTSSPAVAAGTISIAFTSTMPIAFNATTTATAIRISSAYWNGATGTPEAAAIAGSYATNSSSR